jgi:Kef-type K+ transport system membrane component KefB
MDTQLVLIVLSSLIILSYLLDLAGKALRIPSVLLLLSLGVLLRYAASHYGPGMPDINGLLPLLGTLGLILIVLEGALDLHLDKSKIPVIRRAFGAALVILIVTSFLIAVLLQIWLKEPFHTSFVNSIPFAVISSAIAIPSVASLTGKTREFIIYESTFSDILGIMLFNFAVTNPSITAGSFVSFGLGFGSILVISVLFSLLLLFLIGRISHHVKFFLILSVLVFVYASGKLFHLSSLLTILVFGLFINNTDIFLIRPLRRFLSTERLKSDLLQFKLITSETAFIIRTFFFILFGYSIDLGSLLSSDVLITGFLIFGAILLIRFLYLSIINRSLLTPEVLIAPRGLITVLLFFSIPEEYRLEKVSLGILLFIVLVTSLVMTLGLLLNRRKSGGAPPADHP